MKLIHNLKGLQPLARILHADLLQEPGIMMNVAGESQVDSESKDTYSPASTCSSALSHQTSQLPAHDQYEISGLALRLQPIVLVGGTFDGVHVGHQALIKSAQDEARAIGAKVVVMTFDRHPASLLRPNVAPALLTTTEQKLTRLQEFGVDTVLLLTFDEQLAAMSATAFITQLNEALPHLKAIAVGASWSFGKGGEGNLDLLKELGNKFHFSVMTIKAIEVNGHAVSSTRIRRAIASADFEEAAACLGRRYSVTGTVVEGNQKARDFGFPTANLSLPPIQLPPDGVYAVFVKIGEATYQGIANIGHCPTISSFPFPTKVEVHLFHFEGDLYGQELTMIPIAHLRPEMKFPNLEELQLQIIKDVAVVKNILQATNESVVKHDVAMVKN